MAGITKWEFEQLCLQRLKEHVGVLVTQVKSVTGQIGYDVRFQIKESKDEIWENYRFPVGMDSEIISMALMDVAKRENNEIDDFTLAGRKNEDWLSSVISGAINKYRIEGMDNFRKVE